MQADGQHVDLYGYTSLTVAAIQAQEEEIRPLQAELAATRAALKRLEARLDAVHIQTSPNQSNPQLR